MLWFYNIQIAALHLPDKSTKESLDSSWILKYKKQINRRQIKRSHSMTFRLFLGEVWVFCCCLGWVSVCLGFVLLIFLVLKRLNSNDFVPSENQEKR